MCLSRSIFQESYIIWMSFLVYMVKMVISLSFYFIFFKILIFWVVRGVIGQKMFQNDKKICLSHLVSQEPYMTWLPFMLHLCKMIISSGGFFIFSKFWFFGLLVGKWAKNSPKWQKNSVSCTPYLGNHTSYGCHLWYTFVKWYHQVFFSFFQNFDFRGS